MKITYANKKVEKFFTDYSKMKKKLPFEWVRSIKKLMNQLTAADNFGIFLSLGIGKPEQLSGYKQIMYSLHVTANVRLIIELNATEDTVKICEEIVVEGVSDYHGDKNNWYIP
ncbi:MAG: type II toxin-antitoxin system RelE/ParE family toxin [Lachnospiraceae bacterium]|nr:type II toxin-antitoxin system RelE/ParE family toxin [Lachnospiraceae bacterium]